MSAFMMLGIVVTVVFILIIVLFIAVVMKHRDRPNKDE